MTIITINVKSTAKLDMLSKRKLHGSFLRMAFNYIKAAEPLRRDSLLDKSNVTSSFCKFEVVCAFFATFFLFTIIHCKLVKNQF